MALSQKLELRQSHALVMTPQLMQAIKLLQLSNLDLATYVENELERNPLLERSGEGEADKDRRTGEHEEAPASDSTSSEWAEGGLDRREGSVEDRLGGDLDHEASDDGEVAARAASPEAPVGYSEWSGTGSAAPRADGDYNLEAFVSAQTTLADHLAEQLALAIADPAQRMIGQYLIDLTDESGYLSGDLTQVSSKLGATAEQVEAVLRILQTFDPPGVCARNLTECLSIQLKERDRFDPAMQALVAHLELLARRDVAALRRICGVSDEDLA